MGVGGVYKSTLQFGATPPSAIARIFGQKSLKFVDLTNKLRPECQNFKMCKGIKMILINRKSLNFPKKHNN